VNNCKSTGILKMPKIGGWKEFVNWKCNYKYTMNLENEHKKYHLGKCKSEIFYTNNFIN
jgi:hypothetical protein